MESKTKSVNELEVEESEKAAILINSDYLFVGVNELKLKETGYNREEIIGQHCNNTIVSGGVKAGAGLQRVLDGEEMEGEIELRRKDGSTYISHQRAVPVEVDGETFAKAVTVDVEETSGGSASKDVDAATFDGISTEQLEEIVKNVRIDAPSGEMPLNAVLLDLAVGHNELEKYKQGALSIHQAIDERLIEEKKNNPDSPEVEVLREAKRSAFGLYLRVQRGDMELHGNREGQYSGYFN